MVNNDVIKKWISNNSNENPDYMLGKFNKDILRIKLGFTGIGNRHFSLINTSDIKRGNKIIWDYYLGTTRVASNSSIISPKIFQIVGLKSYGDSHNLGILLGIGNGNDDSNLQIGKTYILDNLDLYSPILRLDSIGRYKSEDKRSNI